MKFKLFFQPVVIAARDVEQANEIAEMREFNEPEVNLIEEISQAREQLE